MAVFSVGDSVTASIAGVTIEDGANPDGGGILNSGGNLTVTNTTIEGCSAVGYSGGTYGYVGGDGGGIYSGGELTLNNCTFSNDQAPDDGGDYTASEGGGLFVVTNATATVANCTFTGDAASLGGGIFNESTGTNFATLVLTNSTIGSCTGDGLDNEGQATVTGCSMLLNSAATTNYQGTAYGSGISNGGTMTVTSCSVEFNSAPDGGGIANLGTMTINSSTISHNNSNNTGNLGGGIYDDGSLTVHASTISNNAATSGLGGGIYIDSSADSPGDDSFADFDDSTIANNSSHQGSGIYAAGGFVLTNCTVAFNFVSKTGGGGGLDIAPETFGLVFNTIVAQNTDNIGADDIVGTVGLGEYDLIGTGGSGGLTDTSGNLVGVVNPGLEPLGNNGGPTQTILPEFGSSAVGAGSVTLAKDANGTPLTFDQRGIGFPRELNGSVDIGAVETAWPGLANHSSGVLWGDTGSSSTMTGTDGVTELQRRSQDGLALGRHQQVPVHVQRACAALGGRLRGAERPGHELRAAHDRRHGHELHRDIRETDRQG